MSRTPGRYKWFDTAQVGQSTVFPDRMPTPGGSFRIISRNLLNGIRAHYQKKYPGRVYQVRTVPEGYFVQRLPDGTQLAKGRPQVSDPKAAEAAQSEAARQRAYRLRKRAQFAYAMSNAANKDPDPEVQNYRRLALFQLQNSTALALEAWANDGKPSQWLFHVRPDMVNAMHPNRVRAVSALVQNMNKETGREFENNTIPVTVGGEERYVQYITLGTPAFHLDRDNAAIEEDALPMHLLRDTTLIDA